MRRHRINTLTKRVIHGKLYSLQEETPNEARIVQILCALHLDLRFFDYIDCCYLELGRLVVLDHFALSAGPYSARPTKTLATAAAIELSRIYDR